MTGVPWLDLSRLTASTATAMLEAALRAGLDPEADPAAAAVDLPGGTMLLAPASGRLYAGVQVVTVAPENPGRGLPLVQGVYLLFHGESLEPLALLDGADLTALRAPAVSALAVRHLTPNRPLSTVLFGTGVQAWGHVQACAAVRRLARLTVVGRDRDRTEAFAARCRAIGVPASTGTPDAVGVADLVLCCTTSATPLFDGSLVPETAAVVTVGAHSDGGREVDDSYAARAAHYVESRTAAGRVNHGLYRAVNLAELLTGPVDLTRPRLFTSVGAAWQDLVVAAAVYERS